MPVSPTHTISVSFDDSEDSKWEDDVFEFVSASTEAGGSVSAGCCVGQGVDAGVGADVGAAVGACVGADVGVGVGEFEGSALGALVADTVGTGDAAGSGCEFEIGILNPAIINIKPISVTIKRFGALYLIALAKLKTTNGAAAKNRKAPKPPKIISKEKA